MQASLFPEQNQPAQKKKIESKIKDPLYDITANRHGGNKESAAANRNTASRKQNQRDQIEKWTHGKGKKGMTTDEAAVHFNTTPNAISGRRTELEVQGILVATEETRKTRTGSPARVFVHRDFASK